MQRETLAILCRSHLLNREAVGPVYLALAKREPKARPLIQDPFAMTFRSVIVAEFANVANCLTLAWHHRLFRHCLTTGWRALYGGGRKLEKVFSEAPHASAT